MRVQSLASEPRLHSSPLSPLLDALRQDAMGTGSVVVPGGQGLDLSGLPLREVTGATDLLRIPWSCGCFSMLFSEGAIKS